MFTSPFLISSSDIYLDYLVMSEYSVVKLIYLISFLIYFAVYLNRGVFNAAESLSEYIVLLKLLLRASNSPEFLADFRACFEGLF